MCPKLLFAALNRMPSKLFFVFGLVTALSSARSFANELNKRNLFLNSSGQIDMTRLPPDFEQVAVNHVRAKSTGEQLVLSGESVQGLTVNRLTTFKLANGSRQPHFLGTKTYNSQGLISETMCVGHGKAASATDMVCMTAGKRVCEQLNDITEASDRTSLNKALQKHGLTRFSDKASDWLPALQKLQMRRKGSLPLTAEGFSGERHVYSIVNYIMGETVPPYYKKTVEKETRLLSQLWPKLTSGPLALAQPDLDIGLSSDLIKRSKRLNGKESDESLLNETAATAYLLESCKNRFIDANEASLRRESSGSAPSIGG